MSSSEAHQDAENIPSDPEVEESEEESEQEEDQDPEQEEDSDQDDGTSPGRWEGSDVSAEAINWLYASRRVPPEVACRRPGKEIEPQPRRGEFVVFLSHFQRGFGLPVSDFFSDFLHRYGLQPHHLPANAIFHLSCWASFSEGYCGLWPTTDTWHKFYSFRGMTVPNPTKKKKTKKVLLQCGAAAIQPKSGSVLPRIKGLESCRKWQKTFFYVSNRGEANLIRLPPFRIGVPTRQNWKLPSNSSPEIKMMEDRIKFFISKGFRGSDMVGTFITRRVAPLQRRAHKMCYMSGHMDPTRTSTFRLGEEEIRRQCKAIAQIKMSEWTWGKRPYSRERPPPKVIFLIRSLLDSVWYPFTCINVFLFHAQKFGRQLTEDGPDPLGPFAPDRTQEDPVEPDTDDYSSIPQFGSVGSTGKPYASPAPQDLSSDDDSEDCQILDPLNPTPLSFAYPLPSTSANPDDPSRAAAQGASEASDAEQAPTRKRTGTANPEPESSTRPTKRIKISKRPGHKPKRRPTADADA